MEKNCEVALVIRLRDSKQTFKAGKMSGLRLFQSARDREEQPNMDGKEDCMHRSQGEGY